MAIEIQSSATGVLPNQSATFTFQQQVCAYAFGIMAMRFSYGPGTDHWIQDFSLHILPNLPTPGAANVIGNQVQAQFDVQLIDSSGNTIDSNASVIYPICVAMTGQADAKTLMTPVEGVANGQQSPVMLPGSGPFSLVTAFLSGFALNSSAQHQVLGASAGCGIVNEQSQGYVKAVATLYDADGHEADSTSVDASVIASINESPGFAMISVDNAQTQDPITVDFSSQLPSVSFAACLITSWQVEYYSVHNFQTLSVGSWGAPTISGTKVTLQNLYTAMNDNSGNNQNDANSNASVLVIALP